MQRQLRRSDERFEQLRPVRHKVQGGFVLLGRALHVSGNGNKPVRRVLRQHVLRPSELRELHEFLPAGHRLSGTHGRVHVHGRDDDVPLQERPYVREHER
jgi:hypothetical protein